MTNGRSLELFFVDGSPDGMLTAEVFNWTGHVLRLPRTRLSEGLKRTEARQTGVYVLLGTDEDGDLAYIGEAEDMAVRLKQHAAQKDWWDSAVLVTTTGDHLHKAHVRYLENRLIQIAKSARSSRLENGNLPAGASLNEAAIANMESFLETLRMVLPAIRVDVFQTRARSVTRDDVQPEQVENVVQFHFGLSREDVSATALLIGDELVVQRGSVIRSDWIGDRKRNTHYWKLYDELLSTGIAQDVDGQRVLTKDYAFSSPSAAAAIVAGRSANGRTSWRLEDGTTYADWEEQQLTGVGE